MSSPPASYVYLYPYISTTFTNKPWKQPKRRYNTYQTPNQHPQPPPSSYSDYSSHPETEKHYTTTTQRPNSGRIRHSSPRARTSRARVAAHCDRSRGSPSAGSPGGYGARRRGAVLLGRRARCPAGWRYRRSCGCRQ